MSTLTQTPQTAQCLPLTPQDRALTAQVCNWDAFQTETYQASDIASVTIQENIVFIHFTNNTATAIDVATFKAKIAEYKAANELSEEQQEIIEAAIDCPFQSEVNFQEAIASFYSDESRFIGTVQRQRHYGLALTEASTTVHKSAESAVQSLTTCTFEEWEQAKAGLEGIRYEGNGF